MLKNPKTGRKLGPWQASVCHEVLANEKGAKDPILRLRGKAAQYSGAYWRRLKEMESMGLVTKRGSLWFPGPALLAQVVRHA